MAVDIGDTRAPFLDVSVYDGNTVVSLTVVRPDGTTSTPALSGPVAQPSGAGRWSVTGPYTLMQAGRYWERWIATNAVTGLGAGAANTAIDVASTPPPSSSAGAWATVADYGSIIGGDFPDDLALKLRMATYALRPEISTSVYDATDATVLQALKEACCWQAKYAADNGWTTGAPALVREMQIGTARLGGYSSQAGGGAGLSPLSPIALEILGAAGLLDSFVSTDTRGVWWP